MNRSRRRRPTETRRKPPAGEGRQDLALRPYEVGDLPRLHAIDRACFPAGIAYSRAQLRSLLEHPSSLSAIAEEGGRVQGFIILRPLGRRSGAGMVRGLHLLTIDVAAEGRRRGIGSLLMRWAFAEGERIRAQLLVLESSVENQTAQAFYARFGFQAVGMIPGYYPGGLDAVSMELILKS